jgi:hypothetical protein
MLIPKENAWRCKKYTDWVKTQPSVLSGLPADDPHHIMGHGLTGGTKAPDWACIPLTRQEHTDFHNISRDVWEAMYGSQADLLLKFWRDNFDTIKEFFK